MYSPPSFRNSTDWSNFINLLFDEYSNLIPRTKGVFCTMNPKNASLYGKLYRIYVPDNTKIVVSNVKDFYDVKYFYIIEWVLKRCAVIRNIDLDYKSEDLNYYLDVISPLNKDKENIDEVFNVLYMKKQAEEFYYLVQQNDYDLIKTIIDLVTDNYSEYKQIYIKDLSFDDFDKEMWFHSKYYFIRENNEIKKYFKGSCWE